MSLCVPKHVPGTFYQIWNNFEFKVAWLCVDFALFTTFHPNRTSRVKRVLDVVNDSGFDWKRFPMFQHMFQEEISNFGTAGNFEWLPLCHLRTTLFTLFQNVG